jgi:CheY-like chemotaxis protein
VIVTVTDNGTGMNPETMERLFEPFFTTKGKDRGTGLGLASVYGIVQSHGGWIDVESKRGVGSVFRIHLPVSPGSVGLPASSKEDELIRGGNETVLIVDDEESIREVAKEALEAYGYSTRLARNGEEGLDLFCRHHGEIDLVILDLSMPKLSGQEAYHRMREIDPDMKVLFCSGYPETSLPEPPSGGVMAYMEKPYRASELVRCVRKTLDEA